MHLAQIVTRGDDLGGAQTHVRDLSAELRAAGHRVTVLSGGCGVFTDELDRLRIPHRDIPHLRRPIHPVRDPIALRELVGALRELGPDLVLTHTAKAGMLGRMAARILGIPAIFTPHGWAISDRISRTQGIVFQLLEKLAAHATDRIVNVCEYERSLALSAGVASAQKMAMVYNGLADVAEGLRAQPATEPPRLVMVARMAAQKDHATLLSAVAGLGKGDWSLDLVGDGPSESSLRLMADRLGLSRRVRFCGFRIEVADLLAGAQIAVLATNFEAFPYAILEAMRAGLPVVASEVGGIPEAVEHGKTGLLVPAGDPEALRDALALLIGNPGLRQRLGMAGRQRFLERFTLGKMLSETLKTYEEVIRERRSRGQSTRRTPRPVSMP